MKLLSFLFLGTESATRLDNWEHGAFAMVLATSGGHCLLHIIRYMREMTL